MPRAQAPIYSLNGGEVSTEATARLDLERLRYAGELYQNVLPKVIGSIQFRGGFGYKADSAVNEDGNTLIPFIFGSTDNALLQFSNDGMRIFDGSAYLTRASVSTTIVNPDFNPVGIPFGWSDESTGSATATGVGGVLRLAGASGAIAIGRQEVTVSAPDRTVEHGLEVDVAIGPMDVFIGSTAGASDIAAFRGLEEGSHRLAFTPGLAATSVFIDLRNEENKNAEVDRVDISAAGQIVVPHPWAISDLPRLKYEQSNDVIFVASGTFQQRRIERRGDTSWSIVRYKANDGPFDLLPDERITLTPSATTGNVTLTASDDLFTSADVGSLFRLTHFSQSVSETLSTPGATTEPIRVSGVDSDRRFDGTVTGSGFTGTVILERAFTEPVNYTPFVVYTGNATINNFDDNRDNQIVYYRFRLEAVSAGTVDVTLDYGGGSTRGVARINTVVTGTSAQVEVLSPFGATTATNQWDRASWSDRNGWPNAVTFFDGRLWWGRGDITYGSASDAFDLFGDEIEGDSAPVIRSIGSTTTEGILWLLGLQRLAAGTSTAEISIRASSFDEPITPTNFVPRNASTRGSADIAAVPVDSEAIFVQRSGDRAYRFAFSADKNDYFAFDLTELNRDILSGGVKKIAVQRHPDTRIWWLLNSGEMRCLVLELDQQVVAWTRVVTDGTFDDFDILPSDDEDRLFGIVKRTVDGNTVRYIEEMAPLSQAEGGANNAMADSFISGTNGPASTTITGLSHLEGEQVVVWADGAVLHDQDSMLTVSGGAITVSTAVTNYMVGLPYIGRWRSTKLAYGSALGTALTQRKRVSHLSLVMQNVGWNGIRLGREFTDMTKLRHELRGRTLATNEVLAEYDYDASQFNGGWDSDSRVSVEMRAPYPATLAAMVISMKTNDQAG
jgi:hypothetical protein